MTLAAKLTIGARSRLLMFFPDSDLTVTGANICKHRETFDLEIRLN
jgi:hypothetical protein